MNKDNSLLKIQPRDGSEITSSTLSLVKEVEQLRSELDGAESVIKRLSKKNDILENQLETIQDEDLVSQK